MRFLIFCLAILTLTAGPALSDIPPLDLSYAEIDPQAVGASLMICPAGDGRPLSEMYDEFGNFVDGTIHLWVITHLGQPVPNYPFEDLWLESTVGSLVFCSGGTRADYNTDADGHTVFQQPLEAGGHSIPGEGLMVMINGSALNQPAFDLSFNSPDIDGDLVVDLSDITWFAMDFFFDYHHRSDLVRDGVINLSDLSVLTIHLGHVCP